MPARGTSALAALDIPSLEPFLLVPSVAREEQPNRMGLVGQRAERLGEERSGQNSFGDHIEKRLCWVE